MKPTETEWILDEVHEITLVELSNSSGLSIDEIRDLMELGVFEPRRITDTECMFTARSIERARTARRLLNDFELNLTGVALALTYIERIRELEQRLQELECQLPGAH